MTPEPTYHGPRWVVCAAIRNRVTGAIIAGARHFDAIMRATIERERDFEGWDKAGNWKKCEQGFIDQGGVFMTRNEAHNLLKKNGQRTMNPLSEKDEGAIVFSEDLY